MKAVWDKSKKLTDGKRQRQSDKVLRAKLKHSESKLKKTGKKSKQIESKLRAKIEELQQELDTYRPKFEAAEVINKSKAEKAEKNYEVLLNKYRQLDFEFEQVEKKMSDTVKEKEALAKLNTETEAKLSKERDNHKMLKDEFIRVSSAIEEEKERNNTLAKKQKLSLDAADLEEVQQTAAKLSPDLASAEDEAEHAIYFKESNKRTIDCLRKTVDALKSRVLKKAAVIASIRLDIDQCCHPKSINEENALQCVNILRRRVDKIITKAAADESSLA